MPLMAPGCSSGWRWERTQVPWISWYSKDWQTKDVWVTHAEAQSSMDSPVRMLSSKLGTYLLGILLKLCKVFTEKIQDKKLHFLIFLLNYVVSISIRQRYWYRQKCWLRWEVLRNEVPSSEVPNIEVSNSEVPNREVSRRKVYISLTYLTREGGPHYQRRHSRCPELYTSVSVCKRHNGNCFLFYINKPSVISITAKFSSKHF